MEIMEIWYGMYGNPGEPAESAKKQGANPNLLRHLASRERGISMISSLSDTVLNPVTPADPFR